MACLFVLGCHAPAPVAPNRAVFSEFVLGPDEQAPGSASICQEVVPKTVAPAPDDPSDSKRTFLAQIVPAAPDRPLHRAEFSNEANGIDEPSLLFAASGSSPDLEWMHQLPDRSFGPATEWQSLWDDQKNFYSPVSLAWIGSGLAVGGILANTNLDENLHHHFQGSVRGATSDEWFESLHASKELGNGLYTLPLFATAWAAGEILPDNQLWATTGSWGERSIRGFVVGAPPLILLQQLTGGARPEEVAEHSSWHPFRDNNGISGHAFMGSLPFITAAKMTDQVGYKLLWYAGSTVAPLSRVNDSAHYPSQVALGWWLAYCAASAVDATEDPNRRWRLYPYTFQGGSGIMAEFRY